MDDNMVYATAQSEQLPVDRLAGAYHGGRPPTACFIVKIEIINSRDVLLRSLKKCVYLNL